MTGPRKSEPTEVCLPIRPLYGLSLWIDPKWTLPQHGSCSTADFLSLSVMHDHDQAWTLICRVPLFSITHTRKSTGMSFVQ